MSLSAAVGAPAPVTIGDKTYQASPLNLFELGAIEETVRTMILNTAARATVGLPAEVRDQLFDRALTKALEVSYGSPEVTRYLQTFPGTCALIATSLKTLHPEVRDTDVAKAFAKHPEQYEVAVATVTRISGFRGGEDKGGASGEAVAESGQSSA